MDNLVGLLLIIVLAFVMGFAGGWAFHTYGAIMATAEYQYQRGLEDGGRVSVNQIKELCK